jgi:SAM-dependent methyltransferase
MSSAHARSWETLDAGEMYEHGRPDYPASLTPLLSGDARLGPQSVVVDVAAGTGKLTRVLATGPARVLAVEPMPGMRAQLRQATPSVPVLAASAEQLPFATGSLDVVTVAQAFHWFRVDEASRELHRVLAPTGHLVLVSNTRDPDHELSRRLWDVLRDFERLAPRPESTRGWRAHLDRLGDFVGWRRHELAHEQVLDGPEELEARFTSISFVLLLAEADRTRLAAALHEVAGSVYPIHLPLRTLVDIGQPAPGRP